MEGGPGAVQELRELQSVTLACQGIKRAIGTRLEGTKLKYVGIHKTAKTARIFERFILFISVCFGGLRLRLRLRVRFVVYLGVQYTIK